MPYSLQVRSSRYIDTISLHDALPIYVQHQRGQLIIGVVLGRVGPDAVGHGAAVGEPGAVLGQRQRRSLRLVEDRGLAPGGDQVQDRKSTRLNSSHVKNSYAVFCL